MLSWLLLILVIAAIAVFGAWVSVSIFGRGEVLPPMDEPHDVIQANRAAVEGGRIDDIALEVVPRGYRQDQVDALVEQLAAKCGMAPGAVPELAPAAPNERKIVDTLTEGSERGSSHLHVEE